MAGTANAGSVVIQIISKDKTEKAVNSAKQRFEKLGREIQKTSLVQAAAFAGITAAVGRAVNEFANFDRGLREISTLLGDVTERDIKQFGEEIIDASTKFGQSVESMSKARYDIISAGFNDAARSAVVLDASAKLATAGLTSVSKTADILTTTLNAYGLEAKEATSISDKMFEVVRLGKTTIDELSSALGQVVAIAPSVNVSFNEVGAAMAALTAQGISTSEAGVALNATMTALLKPSEAMKERLHELGFATGAAIVGAKGFAETVKLLTENVDEAEVAARFPNIRAMRAIFPLIGSAADKFADALGTVAEASGTTDRAFLKITNSIAFRIATMREKVNAAVIRIGEALVPLAERLADIVDKFSNLSTSTIQFMAKLTVAIGGGIVAMKAFAAVTAALTLTLGPAGALLVGLGAAIVLFDALSTKTDKAKEEALKFADVMENINAKTAVAQLALINLEMGELEGKAEKARKKIEEITNRPGNEFGTGGAADNARGFYIAELKEIVQRQNVLKERTEELTDVIKNENKAREDAASAAAKESAAKAKLTGEINALQKAIGSLDIGIDVDRINKQLSGIGVTISETKGSIDNQLANILGDLEAEKKSLLVELDFAAATDNTDAFNVINSELNTVEENIQQLQETINATRFEFDTADAFDALREQLQDANEEKLSILVKGKVQLEKTGSISEELQKEYKDIVRTIDAIEEALESPKFKFEVDTSGLAGLQKILDDAFAQTVTQDYEAEDAEFAQREAEKTERLIEAERKRAELLAEIREESAANDLESQRMALEEKLSLIDENWRQQEELTNYYNEKMSELQLESVERQLETVGSFLDQAEKIFSSYLNMEVKKAENQTKELIKNEKAKFEGKKKEIIAQNTVEGKLTEQGKALIEQLETEHQTKIVAIQDEGQEREKEILAKLKPVKYAQAISNIALAVTKALSSTIPPANFVLAGLVGAAGALQLATISAQPYKTGGVVGDEGQIKDQLKIINFNRKGDDTVPAMLQPGEIVVPKKNADLIRQDKDLMRILLGDANRETINQYQLDKKLQSLTLAGQKQLLFGGNVDLQDSKAFSGGGIVTQAVHYAEGGIVGGGGVATANNQYSNDPVEIGSAGSRETGSQTADRVIVNLNMEVNTIDAQGVEDFIKSGNFRVAFSDAVNDGLIRLKSFSIHSDTGFFPVKADR